MLDADRSPDLARTHDPITDAATLADDVFAFGCGDGPQPTLIPGHRYLILDTPNNTIAVIYGHVTDTFIADEFPDILGDRHRVTEVLERDGYALVLRHSPACQPNVGKDRTECGCLDGGWLIGPALPEVAGAVPVTVVAIAEQA
jgi:hypothetical protein